MVADTLAMKDPEVRAAAFAWLEEQTEVYDHSLPRSLLATGFMFQGERIPLVSPQGIFKPRVLDLPLTITTVFGGRDSSGQSAKKQNVAPFNRRGLPLVAQAHR
jgi:hypothetical protein